MDIISYSAAATAKKIANSKVKHYNQDTVPTTSQVGDTWYRTSNGVTYTRVSDGVTEAWLDTSTGMSTTTGLEAGDFKTINGESIVGAGDILLTAGPETPQLSTYVVTLNELQTADITIGNYSDIILYSTSTGDAGVATAAVVADTLTITAADVVSDASTTIRVNAAIIGLGVSDWVDITVNVTNVPIEADTAITYTGTDFTLTGITYA